MSDPRLQAVVDLDYAEAWETFVERHNTLCGQCTPEDLIGNLELCPAMDGDVMGNFAYGSILTLRRIASECDLTIGLAQTATVH